MTKKLKIPAHFNAADFFIDRHVKSGRGEKIALRYLGKRITYGELQIMVNKAGNALLKAGFKKKSRVLMTLPDSPELISCFFGAIKTGIVPVLLNPLLHPDDYSLIINDCKAVAAIIDPSLKKLFRKLIKESDGLKKVIITGNVTGKEISFYDLVRKSSSNLRAIKSLKNNSAFWLYSSGSTGKPKGIVHPQRTLLACFNNFGRRVLGIKELDVVFSTAKMSFSYGLGANLAYSLGIGAQSVIFPDWSIPEKIFKTIEKEKPTILFAVPAIYARMLGMKNAEKRFDWSSLRICVSSGESLPPEIYRQWAKRFKINILDALGSTEMLQPFIANRPEESRPGSAGKIVPGYRAVLVDDSGKLLPQGAIGNLRVSGDSMMLGYWDGNRIDKKLISGKWLETGDKCSLGKDGRFRYHGRKDDLIKVNALWVSPLETENVLLAHPRVAEAAVVERKDANGLTRLKAYVVLKGNPGNNRRMEEILKNYIKTKLTSYKSPKWVKIVKILPRTPTGKIQRFKLREAI